jgi:hypothetical protein
MFWNSSSEYLTFLRRILAFSLFLGLVAGSIKFLAPAKYITPALPWLFVFFFAVTLAGYYFLLRSSREKFIRFVNTYLLVTVVKLFLFVGIIFIYLLNNRQDAAAFAFSFLILYLCYMIFEVVNLVSHFNPRQK